MTRAQGHAVASPDSRESGSNGECEFVVPLPDLPPSVSREEWVESQQADPTLSALLAGVLPGDQVREVAHGYFFQKGLLVQKWVPCEGDFVREPVFQVVVPENYCHVVLKITHDDSGHLGVRKTYDRILRYFFLAQVTELCF